MANMDNMAQMGDDMKGQKSKGRIAIWNGMYLQQGPR